MSDEIEDISVEAESPASGGVGGGAGGVEAPVAVMTAEPALTSVDETPSEVQPTLPSIEVGKGGYLAQAAQDAYQEQYAPQYATNKDAPAVTEVGRQEQEAAKEEKKAQFFEHMEQQAKEAERREEWLKKEHDFAGMKMSGHDLDKLINLYANNPAMQDKLRDRMQQGGKSKAEADRAVKEFTEYMALLKKESEGKELSEEEKRRKQELSKDEGVRVAAQQAVRIAQEYGVPITPKMQEVQIELSTVSAVDLTAKAEIQQKANSSQVMKNVVVDDDVESEGTIAIVDDDTPEKVAKVTYVSATARENFPNAPAVKEDFTASSSGNVVAIANAPKLSQGPQGMNADSDDTLTSIPVAGVSMAQKMPLQPSARA